MKASELPGCRLCGNVDLENVLSLGQTPLANAFLTNEQLLARKKPTR